MSYFLERTVGNFWVGKFSNFASDFLTHGISTRPGGVSKGVYASLNLALHVGDSAEDVWENRKRFSHMLGIDARRICTAEQIHSDRVAIVLESDAGRGTQVYTEAIAGTDALITNQPNLPLMLCFADCTPILFFDEENLAIGVAHGGWKGTAARIAPKTLRAMQETYGTNPEKCRAGIGPAIGSADYPIGGDVERRFREEFEFADQILTMKDGRCHLDLWEANRLSLMEAGMRAENIEVAGVSTATENTWYYSYRADGGVTGRIAAILALKGR